MDEVAEFFKTKNISEDAREVSGGHYMLWALYDNLINGNYPVPVTWEILRFMVRESFVSAAEKAAEETANYFCRSFDRRTLGVADAPCAIRSNNSWDSIFYSVLESAIERLQAHKNPFAERDEIPWICSAIQQ